MKGKELFVFLLLCYLATVRVDAHCRVMADCGENVTWKELRGGPPGEQGPPGPPGPPLDMAELLQEIEETRQKNEGPVLHFYTQTITWSTGKAFCQSLGKTLCHSTQLCFADGENGQSLIPDVLSGDHWVPVLDSTNEWLETGDSDGRTCGLHSVLYNPPAWGTSTTAKPYKGYVYCCAPGFRELDVKYRFIGQTATYKKSKQHCEQRGRRLCYISEVCVNNVPRFGVIRGDHWVAVKDQENEWVQVGDDLKRTCWVHGVHYNAPPWGVRTTGKVDHVGYVLCCPIEPQ